MQNKILGIDSVSGRSGVALIGGDGIIEERRIDHVNGRPSKNLLVEIDKLFQETKTDISEVSSVGITNGPGSLTGIRVGISMVHGLLFESRIPVVAVNTFDATEKASGRKNDLQAIRIRKTEWLLRTNGKISSADEKQICDLINSVKTAAMIGSVPNEITTDLLVIETSLARSVAEIAKNVFQFGNAMPIEQLSPFYFVEIYSK